MKHLLFIAWLGVTLAHAEKAVEVPETETATATIEAAPADPTKDKQPEQEVADARKPGCQCVCKCEHETPVTKHKPLDNTTIKGLAWLVKTQNNDGGWGQGGGWRTSNTGRIEGEEVEDPSDIGNTAMAMQAFLRAGAGPNDKEYGSTVSKATEFILNRIEKCDNESLYVTDVRNTQLQSKIGTYVDTFLTAQLLSDLKGHVSGKNEERREAMLNKVIAKIEKHQKDNGAFAGNNGWAATLSQGLCSRALNSAWAAGADIQLATLEKDHAQNAVGLNRVSGVVASSGPVSDAGVEIYRYSSKLGGMSKFRENNDKRRKELDDIVKSDAPADKKEAAQAELEEIKSADRDQEVLLKQVAARAKEEGFVKGFGNNGGEEFISYMNIGEALHQKGGDEWIDWEKMMRKTLATAQNEDGSWAGQHCITGRTFCTSSALMVLMSDRSKIVPAQAMKE